MTVDKEMRRKKFRYSVSEQDVSRFIEDNINVREFLNKYGAGVTYTEKAFGLARFFRWLKVVKGLRLTPAEFLDLHLQKRGAKSVAERRWALKLALEYSRDNPDLKGKAANYKYSAWFLPVKLFCDYHEAPLTNNRGFFPKRGRRKYPEKPFTVEYIKKILSILSQRDRAVCLCELQAGQAIQQVLEDMNKQAKRVFKLIDGGAARIRFDFDERKGNGFAYFSFISRDCIQELQKWRPIREKILRRIGKDSPYIFITNTGKPYPRKHFHNNVRLTWKRHGFHDRPLSVRSHGFRKFFEQEASPPERGISKAYVTFMMGHSEGKDSNGIRITHPLDAVGGTYDNAPHVYPDVVEKEYVKLEPFINIYSGGRPADRATDLSPEQQSFFEKFARVLDEHPDKFDKFEKFILDL